MLKSSNRFPLAIALALAVFSGCDHKKPDDGGSQSKVEIPAAKAQSADTSKPKPDAGLDAFDTSFEGYKSSKLGAAIHSGSLDEFKRLIQAGASPEKCLTDETYIFDALYTAIAFNQRAIFDYILQDSLYKDVNKTYTEDAETPLTLACAIPNKADALQVSRTLIAHGAKASGAGNSGGENTLFPLIIAVKQNNVELVRLLLENGANKEVKDNTEATPVKIAKDSGFTEIANLLGPEDPK